MESLDYIIISPVKDEERHVGLTLELVARQTRKPLSWIIVDDGSRDRTAEIVRGYCEAHPFMRLVHHPGAGVRQTGAAVIRAFNYGYENRTESPYDLVVKLDCDLSFGPEFFETIVQGFAGDERMGIASGIYLEQDKNKVWQEVEMPPYHAAGACKVVRRDCFEDIGGFIAAPGWDTVDEIRAMTLGWKTGHFKEARAGHHKPEGSALGMVRTSRMHGEIYYRTGGDLLFFALKVLHRLGARPYGKNALALTWGYIRAAMRRTPPLVTPAEADHYRSLLRGQLRRRIKRVFHSETALLAG